MCCDAYCSGHVCLNGFSDKKDMHRITCGSALSDCNNDICCDATCSNDGFSCGSNLVLGATSASVTCGATASDCTVSLCCDASCAGYTCSATFTSKRNSATQVCGKTVADCDDATCCDATCEMFTCPPELQRVAASTVCEGDCTQVQCCQALCSQHSCSPGHSAVGDNHLIVCGSNVADCTDARCCDPTCDNGAFACPSYYGKKKNAAELSCGTSVDDCTVSMCCDAYCSGHVCENGYSDKENMHTIVCGSTIGECNNDICCDATCSNDVISCGSEFVLKADAATIKCGATPGDCHSDICCDATCDAFECPVYFESIPQARDVLCEGECTPAQCCQALCSQHVCSPGHTAIAGNGLIVCGRHAEDCTDSRCCDPTCDNGAFACPSSFGKKKNAAELSCGESAADCTVSMCCDAYCSGHVCGNGYSDKKDKGSVLCGASPEDCTPFVCCDAVPLPTLVPSTAQPDTEQPLPPTTEVPATVRPTMQPMIPQTNYTEGFINVCLKPTMQECPVSQYHRGAPCLLTDTYRLLLRGAAGNDLHVYPEFVVVGRVCVKHESCVDMCRVQMRVPDDVTERFLKCTTGERTCERLTGAGMLGAAKGETDSGSESTMSLDLSPLALAGLLLLCCSCVAMAATYLAYRRMRGQSASEATLEDAGQEDALLASTKIDSLQPAGGALLEITDKADGMEVKPLPTNQDNLSERHHRSSRSSSNASTSTVDDLDTSEANTSEGEPDHSRSLFLGEASRRSSRGQLPIALEEIALETSLLRERSFNTSLPSLPRDLDERLQKPVLEAPYSARTPVVRKVRRAQSYSVQPRANPSFASTYTSGVASAQYLPPPLSLVQLPPPCDGDGGHLSQPSSARIHPSVAGRITPTQGFSGRSASLPYTGRLPSGSFNHTPRTPQQQLVHPPRPRHTPRTPRYEQQPEPPSVTHAPNGRFFV
eukprot:Rhum_TRINITY_DN14339_c0_g1::Rhum_TRINITY_DN14339_c0_g1_i4::g.81535::m.81535